MDGNAVNVFEPAGQAAPRPLRIEPALTPQSNFFGMFSECGEMRKIFGIVERIARTPSTVLVLGDSGTGKELIARAIHKLSGRTGKLVPVNCGAIPEEILESELFGHEKGAFTGAAYSKIGRFQLADKGTIFLDEIGEMSPKLQVKLLRVLQDRIVEPVGSTKSVEVDVRVIAATNKELWHEVQAGRFREDLFYRLQVLPVHLPPLRDRGGDISFLAQYFLERAGAKLGKTSLALSEDALAKLQGYAWPGNVRELENFIERTVILCDKDLIEVSDLPQHIALANRAKCSVMEISEEIPSSGLDFNDLVNKYETRLISMALNQTGGNKKAAAKLLRLNRTTLVEKIKKKGLELEVETIIEPDAALESEN